MRLLIVGSTIITAHAAMWTGGTVAGNSYVSLEVGDGIEPGRNTVTQVSNVGGGVQLAAFELWEGTSYALLRRNTLTFCDKGITAAQRQYSWGQRRRGISSSRTINSRT